jgi:TfoX/Sxy family transcriptional regulator of competence genes
MAFDEILAGRIRRVLARQKSIKERKMFGGIAFFYNGNILVGVLKDSLIVRLGRDEGEIALKEPYVREFDITGKALRGWAVVQPEGIEDDDSLAHWIGRAKKFVKLLPAKS